jgi:hypothetical protein
MKKIISVIALIATMAVTAFAIEPPTAIVVPLPIKSQDVLREYALGKAVSGYRDVSADSMVFVQDQPTWVQVRGNSAEDVLDKLFSTEIVYKLANKLDQITGRVWLYDEFGNLLFYGSSQYFEIDLQKGPGPTYNIWMQSIPILNNVLSAEILVLGEDGKTVRKEQVGITQDGQVQFNAYYSGVTNGILSIKFKDGTLATYNLWAPVANTPSDLSESANWKIEGHYVVPPSEKDMIVVDILETWTLPTALIDCKAGQVIRFNVIGILNINGVTSAERPIRAILTPVGNESWSAGWPMSPDGPTEIKPLVSGQNRVHFEWDKYGKPGMLYTGPIEVGGKGI